MPPSDDNSSDAHITALFPTDVEIEELQQDGMRDLEQFQLRFNSLGDDEIAFAVGNLKVLRWLQVRTIGIVKQAEIQVDALKDLTSHAMTALKEIFELHKMIKLRKQAEYEIANVDIDLSPSKSFASNLLLLETAAAAVATSEPPEVTAILLAAKKGLYHCPDFRWHKIALPEEGSLSDHYNTKVTDDVFAKKHVTPGHETVNTLINIMHLSLGIDCCKNMSMQQLYSYLENGKEMMERAQSLFDRLEGQCSEYRCDISEEDVMPVFDFMEDIVKASLNNPELRDDAKQVICDMRKSFTNFGTTGKDINIDREQVLLSNRKKAECCSLDGNDSSDDAFYFSKKDKGNAKMLRRRQGGVFNITFAMMFADLLPDLLPPDMIDGCGGISLNLMRAAPTSIFEYCNFDYSSTGRMQEKSEEKMKEMENALFRVNRSGSRTVFIKTEDEMSSLKKLLPKEI